MNYKYHYTPYNGWINDPNGLIFYEGIYHLYFQHNPDASVWGDIGWGHAVSEDLINWKTYGEVMRPDDHGMIYSGSAVEEKGVIYYFYTAANDGKEKHFTQRMAVSRDNGYTLEKDSRFEVPVICCENRDPKVIWHEESGAYIMIIWLEKDDFAILRSKYIRGPFELTQRIRLPEGFECPNMFEIDGTWFIWVAGGCYYPGRFDGYRFEWNGIVHKAYADEVPYAAQIFSGTGKDVIMIPWLRVPQTDQKWCGVMGIPRKLGCIHKGEDALITQKAVFADSKDIKDENIREIMIEDDTVLKVEIDK